jgi:site-specific DNA recombinase
MARSTSKPTTDHLRAIAYVRVSTAGQVEDGVSLDAQRSKIAAWCAVMGYELVQTYADEGISGSRVDKRPGLQAALDAVCAPGGVLVVYSLSRLARNTAETIALSERLDKAGADLVSLSEKIDTTSAAGKMVFRMLAVLAEFERDQISERTTMALQHKKAQGERVGTCNYGFTVEADGKMLVPDIGEQAVMATIRQYRAQGLSLRAIVTAAAAEGLTSRVGTPLTLTQVARICQAAA